MTVHECPHCECSECEMCGTPIEGDPYRSEIEWFKSAPMYSKQKTPGRVLSERELCSSCAKDTVDAIRGAVLNDGWGDDDE